MMRARPRAEHSLSVGMALLLAPCLAALCASSPVRGEDAHFATPEQAMQAARRGWEDRLAQSSAVRYKLKGEALHTAGSLVGPHDPDVTPAMKIPPEGIPQQDTAYGVRFEWLLDFENSLFRKEMHEMSFNMKRRAFRPFVRVEVHDGKGLKGYWPRDLNTTPQHTPHRYKEELMLWRENDSYWIFANYDRPILFAHGLFEFNYRDLASGTAQSLGDLQALGFSLVGGRQCVVASADRFSVSGAIHVRETFFIDAERVGAVVRWESERNGRLADRLDIDYRQYDVGWYPSRWVHTHFGPGKDESSPPRVVSRYSLDVELIETDRAVTPADFQVPMRPGMIVLRREDVQRFTVEADGKTLVPLNIRPKSRLR